MQWKVIVVVMYDVWWSWEIIWWVHLSCKKLCNEYEYLVVFILYHKRFFYFLDIDSTFPELFFVLSLKREEKEIISLTHLMDFKILDYYKFLLKTFLQNFLHKTLDQHLSAKKEKRKTLILPQKCHHTKASHCQGSC